MKRVMQTKFGGKEGNCWAACIASILELNIEEVPNFCAGEDIDGKPCDPNQWFNMTINWLKRRGYTMIFFLKPNIFRPDAFHIISGRSPRGAYDHCVVAYGMEMRHDPHPSGDFLACKTEDIADSILIMKQRVI